MSAIMCGQAFGGPSGPIHLENATISDADPGSPYDGQAEFVLGSNGEAYEYRKPVSGSDVQIFTWLLSGSAGDYEARVTVTSGTLDSGTADTWEVLSTSRRYGVARTTTGSESCTFDVEIRDTATQTVQASCTVTTTVNNG